MKIHSDRYLCYPNYPGFPSTMDIQSFKRNTLTVSPNPTKGLSFFQLIQNNPQYLIRRISQRIEFSLNLMHATMDCSALRKHLFFLAGVNHMSMELTLLLKEASYLNCAAIIPPFVLHPVHNLNRVIQSSVLEYYDLSRSFLKSDEGEKKRLNYVFSENFFQRPGRYRVHFFSQMTNISPQKTGKKTILARYHKRENAFYKMQDKPALYDFHQKNHMHLELSAPLKKIAQQVSAKLGHHYILRYRLPYDMHQPYNAKKIKKYLETYYPKHLSVLNHFLFGENLCKQLIMKLFPVGSNLYIASNLWKPYDEECFGPLRAYYKVYRYNDFPELISFVEGEQPNTAKLFLIEKFLMQQNSANSIVLDYFRLSTTFSTLLKIFIKER